MSKFDISEPGSNGPRLNPVAAGCWQLALALWVGGLWLVHFLVLPAIAGMGLAPLLVDEIRVALLPRLVVLAAGAALIQAGLLVYGEGLASLWRDLRGQLLLAALALVLVYFAVPSLGVEAPRWQLFNYLMVALCGVLLVLQPAPGSAPGRAAAGDGSVGRRD